MTQEASWEEHQSLKRAERRLGFLRRLQELINKIHSTENIDEIMLDLSRDICSLFSCDRLTLYTVSPCRTAIESKIKTGMDSFKNFSLPIANSSIAGHVALTKRSFNIRDVYDSDELRSYSRELRFLDKVDTRTGYHTREMVAAPLVNARTGELLGVLQLINNRMGGPFPELVEEGVRELCKTLAIAFEQRLKTPETVHTRFDPLVVLGSLSRPELELAKRTARRKRLHLEDVLIDEFQVTPAQLGAAYAQFFGVPYEPFQSERRKLNLPHNFKREYVEHNGWLILEESGKTLTVVALDLDRLRATRTVEDLFPEYDVQLRVTTRREFLQTVEQLYGSATAPANPRSSDDALIERLHRIISDALASGAPELQANLQAAESQIARISGASSLDGSAKAQLTIRIELKLP